MNNKMRGKWVKGGRNPFLRQKNGGFLKRRFDTMTSREGSKSFDRITHSHKALYYKIFQYFD